jgi:two-component system OmpR family response regulator
MRVLLVEDDPMIGAAIQAALKDASYAADWVKNGKMALSALDCQYYDLVLLDLGLPGMDGLGVLAAIREKRNPIPLLMAGLHGALVLAADAGARIATVPRRR